MSEHVSVTVDDAVATVRLTRPQTLNSLTREVFADLVDAGLRVRDDAAIRAVVLAGEGRAFSSGLDMSEFGRMVDDSGEHVVEIRERLGAARALAQQAVHVWSLVEAPVIAGIAGVAFGGGLQIALGADMRIVAPGAKLSMMEINWGIVPDMCGTQLLPRLVGPARAKHLILTGEVISGEEGYRLGLAEELAEEPVERAHALARELAGKSGTALRRAKELIDLAGTVPFSDALDAEQRVLAELMGGAEQKAAVAARTAELRAQRRG
ncbi:crotonase/enoyl-CoA hydratase family protein [Brevibacterium sp. 5221]|uniref:Crotonase/enoyl-CoA hydratase family protein n=1 Tax=Brevibacterium rongguiense TaxID=2695267 RepID=A0A6N9H5D9_9MICO|nr:MULTISPECIES: crotonase/enoyl-CoA hydratase family protein [Brevibacterium]MYM19277.1 crotonase/enoyl-CoA hydratase family protein [Brevibacterium rongguiense]WAL39799.1 crotonase/enoyl-CoA hydratase family protein [Brevibacterium sp. BRM-1]